MTWTMSWNMKETAAAGTHAGAWVNPGKASAGDAGGARCLRPLMAMSIMSLWRSGVGDPGRTAFPLTKVPLELLRRAGGSGRGA
jgi:hypothetical protein